VALIVTVAALPATLVTDAVIPVGAEAVVVPADVVYHCIVPGAPAAMLAVVTAKVAEPAVPALIVPLCPPSVTVLGADMTSVATPDCVPSIVTRK